MAIKRFYVESKKRLECIDITEKVNEILKGLNGKYEICNVFVPHATAAIAIIENYDANICTDFHNFMAKAIPKGKWLHDRIDGNGDAHIKAAMIGPSETIPVKDELLLGTWQSLVLVELDGPRKREIIVSFS